MARNEKWWRIYRRTRRDTPAERRRVAWCWRHIYRSDAWFDFIHPD